MCCFTWKDMDQLEASRADEQKLSRRWRCRASQQNLQGTWCQQRSELDRKKVGCLVLESSGCFSSSFCVNQRERWSRVSREKQTESRERARGGKNQCVKCGSLEEVRSVSRTQPPLAAHPAPCAAGASGEGTAGGLPLHGVVRYTLNCSLTMGICSLNF